MSLPGVFDSLSQSSAFGGAGRLTALLRGWREGLMNCLPMALRRQLARADTRLEFRLEGARASVWLCNAGAEERLGELGRDDAQAIRDLVSGAGHREAGVVVSVPSGQVLGRHVRFPAQVKENLRRVIEYELDRLTPFSVPDVYFDFRAVALRGQDQVGVEIALIPRASVESWLDELRAQGVPIAALAWEGAWREANLLPPGARAHRGKQGRWAGRLLWGGVMVLGAMVLFTPLWQKREIVIDLGNRLDTAQRVGDKVLALRTELEEATRSAGFVLNEKRGSNYLVDLLRILTELVPDHTWIHQFDYHNGTVQIRGDSIQATSLIEILAREPAFRNVSFRSPVVGVPNTDRERFHISFDFVKPGAG